MECFQPVYLSQVDKVIFINYSGNHGSCPVNREYFPNMTFDLKGLKSTYIHDGVIVSKRYNFSAQEIRRRLSFCLPPYILLVDFTNTPALTKKQAVRRDMAFDFALLLIIGGHSFNIPVHSFICLSKCTQIFPPDVPSTIFTTVYYAEDTILDSGNAW